MGHDYRSMPVYRNAACRVLAEIEFVLVHRDKGPARSQSYQASHCETIVAIICHKSSFRRPVVRRSLTPMDIDRRADKRHNTQSPCVRGEDSAMAKRAVETTRLCAHSEITPIASFSIINRAGEFQCRVLVVCERRIPKFFSRRFGNVGIDCRYTHTRTYRMEERNNFPTSAVHIELISPDSSR